MATVVGIYILALSGFLRLVSAVFPSRFLFLHYFVLSLSLSPLALCQIVLPAVLSLLFSPVLSCALWILFTISGLPVTCSFHGINAQFDSQPSSTTLLSSVFHHTSHS